MLDNNVEPKPEPDLLDLYLALYDTLVDDDEDVRDQGALTVSSMLSPVGSDPSSEALISLSLSPPAAKRRLLDFMQEGYRAYATMYTRAIGRLTGLQLFLGAYSEKGANDLSEEAMNLRSVAKISLEALRPQFAVFVEEKQNLYVDMAKEAEVWAEHLSKIDANAYIPEIADALEDWAADGLSHFIDTLMKSEDAALGPTSVPDVFAICMRTILAARVILTLPCPSSAQRKSGRNGEKPCRRWLQGLLEIGREKHLHSLLIDQINRALEEVKESRNE